MQLFTGNSDVEMGIFLAGIHAIWVMYFQVAAQILATQVLSVNLTSFGQLKSYQ